MLEELENKYKTAQSSHSNRYACKGGSLSMQSSESGYRDSAKALKDAYALFAAESGKQGSPLPRWI
jgi:hypothetical protein